MGLWRVRRDHYRWRPRWVDNSPRATETGELKHGFGHREVGARLATMGKILTVSHTRYVAV